MNYDLYPKQIINNIEYYDFKQIDHLEKSTQYLSNNLNKNEQFQNLCFRKAFRNILSKSNMIKQLEEEWYEVAKWFIFAKDSKEEMRLQLHKTIAC